MKQKRPQPLKASQIKVMGNWHVTLAEAISELGNPGFEMALVRALRQVIEFDYSVMWAYHAEKKPFDLFDTFDGEKKDVLVTQYLEGPYLLDPFYQACQREIEPGLYRINSLLSVQLGHSEYFKTYYKNARLTDEACFILYPCPKVGVVVSLMRDSSSSAFTASETRILDNVEPIIQQLGNQHWRHIGDQFSGVKDKKLGLGDIDRVFETFLQEALSPRERQVVSLVLKGYSSIAIASELALAVSTVKTYRRNIYAKLGISSQSELFSLFLKAISHQPDE